MAKRRRSRSKVGRIRPKLDRFMRDHQSQFGVTVAEVAAVVAAIVVLLTVMWLLWGALT